MVKINIMPKAHTHFSPPICQTFARFSGPLFPSLLWTKTEQAVESGKVITEALLQRSGNSQSAQTPKLNEAFLEQIEQLIDHTKCASVQLCGRRPSLPNKGPTVLRKLREDNYTLFN
jgi:hypothetical protein